MENPNPPRSLTGGVLESLCKVLPLPWGDFNLYSCLLKGKQPGEPSTALPAQLPLLSLPPCLCLSWQALGCCSSWLIMLTALIGEALGEIHLGKLTNRFNLPGALLPSGCSRAGLWAEPGGPCRDASRPSVLIKQNQFQQSSLAWGFFSPLPFSSLLSKLLAPL